jgi:CheY-like chemotaxis protein
MEFPKTVMIIDDDDDDRNLFCEALEEIHPSCHLIAVSNGRESLEKLKIPHIELPDLIFLDLNMPVMNGLQCLDQIRQIDALKLVPVVIYTTSSRIENLSKLKASEPLYFLTKPARFKEIVAVVTYLTTNEWWEDGDILTKSATGIHAYTINVNGKLGQPVL